MTINELEQAMRNLIASQPMITSSPSGEVINSALSIVYSYREFMFRLQAHPYQDALKMNMQVASQTIENDLVISICQILQERGINIMLYAPVNQFAGAIPPVNFQRPVVAPAPQPQMVYGNAQMPPYTMAGMPNQQFFPQPGYAQPVMPPQGGGARRTAPNFQRASNPVPPVAPPMPQPQPPEPAKPRQKVAPVQEPEPPTPAKPPVSHDDAPPPPKSTKKQAVESLLGEAGAGEPSGKAAGRDYLLELLKK